MGLLREGELTVTDITIIVVLSGTALIGAFSAVIFFLVCRKQRKTKKAMKKMHEEQMIPFVDHQNVAPAGAQSDPAETLRYSHETSGQPQYDGPLELQGSGRHEPLPPQQLDGYVAAPTFDDARPFELPTNAVHSNTNSKSWRYK